MKSKYYCFILLSVLFFGCKPESLPEPQGRYSSGIFVVNEGIYGQTSGSISYYNPDSGTLAQDIFRLANGRDLGNVVQSLYFHDEKAYIVVNNSNKIEVANAADFIEIAQINGLEQPRYFLPISAERALVTQWGNDLLSGSLALIDLRTNSVIQKITAGIGKGPERMLLHNNKVYIVNVGGLEFDNFISVLNAQTLALEDTIRTEDAPNSLQMASNGKIWVACKGKTVFSNYPDIDTSASTYGSLLEIDPLSASVERKLLLQKGKGASALTLGSPGEMFFLYDNAIYRLETDAAVYTAIISGSFYGLGAKSLDNAVYASSYSGIQAAKVYRINSTSGIKTDSFNVGTFANAILFKQ
jgi:hypothetical protein